MFAEREGFEPPEPFSSTVFKTAVIDHSTTSPSVLGTANLSKLFNNPKNFCVSLRIMIIEAENICNGTLTHHFEYFSKNI